MAAAAPRSTTTSAALDIVVRFSTADPDLVLHVAAPARTTGLVLKQLVRAQLTAPSSASRLRLIHAGKVIPDGAPLSRSLTAVALPPPPSASDGNDAPLQKSAKARGKQPLRERSPPPQTPALRLYVHCSVGDVLSAADLAAEARAAQQADAALTRPVAGGLVNGLTATTTTGGAAAAPGGHTSQQSDDSAETTTTTTPAPRGFDRLLSAGFSGAEVAALRAQFLAIQAHTHTPDTMPTGQELLTLEERWLESGSSPAGGVDRDGAGGGGGFGFEDTGGLEDMLYGNLVGFFWPIGAVCWLMREEGVWSRRRQIAVLSGFLVNLAFGFWRVMN